MASRERCRAIQGELGAKRVATGPVGALLGMGKAWCGARKNRGLGAIGVGQAWEKASLELVGLFFVGLGYCGLHLGL